MDEVRIDMVSKLDLAPAHFGQDYLRLSTLSLARRLLVGQLYDWLKVAVDERPRWRKTKQMILFD